MGMSPSNPTKTCLLQAESVIGYSSGLEEIGDPGQRASRRTCRGDGRGPAGDLKAAGMGPLKSETHCR